MSEKKDNQYFKWGLTAVTVIAVSIILYVIFTNIPGFFSVLSKLMAILAPLIIGIVIAFLLNPLMVFVEKRMQLLLNRRNPKNKKLTEKISRLVGIFFALVFAALIIYAFFAMLVPQLYESIKSIVESAPAYYLRAETWVTNILEDNPDIQNYVNTAMTKVYDYINDWVNTRLLSDMQKVITALSTSVYGVIKGVLNFVIGIVAAIYILDSKDIFRAQSKKIICANFKPAVADELFAIGRDIHRIFSGFVIGKIIDSAIIGIICYIGMSILKMPFAALISTIIGVTNVIPFFGPFIGLIPSALLILLINPLEAFYFVIFIIILQQVDGNVIGPRILGDTVGISGFWVLISITVASSLFGFAGMLLGVPVFAVIYSLVGKWINRRLKKKNLTMNTDEYGSIKSVSDLKTDKAETEEQAE